MVIRKRGTGFEDHGIPVGEVLAHYGNFIPHKWPSDSVCKVITNDAKPVLKRRSVLSSLIWQGATL